MKEYPQDYKYTQSHEWIIVEEDNFVRVGITEHAQSLLGDIVFIELPECGQECHPGDEIGVVESVKAASDIYSPVAGTVKQVNEALRDNPQLINQSPFDNGWLFEIELNSNSDLEELLNVEQYIESINDD